MDLILVSLFCALSETREVAPPARKRLQHHMKLSYYVEDKMC